MEQHSAATFHRALRVLLKQVVDATLGSPVREVRGLAGEDISEVYQLNLVDGREVFTKTHRSPPPGFFEAEAAGLGWLAETGALQVPAVEVNFMALEYLSSAPCRAGFDNELTVGGYPCPKGPLYRPREFHQSAFWRILVDHGEHFLKIYESRFGESHGPLPSQAEKVIDKLVRCGDPNYVWPPSQRLDSSHHH